MAEMVEGYNFLMKLKKEITVMGSARFSVQDEYYQIAQGVGAKLAKSGFTIITGGGPGIMEAANRGAFEVGGASVGLNIQLPMEQRVNPYVKDSIGFFYFFTRKVMLTSPANAFVFFPGGYGTMDEFFEVVDLMDQRLLSRAPIVLVGKTFWEPLLSFLKEECVGVGSIPRQVIDTWHVVDTADDVYELLKDVRDNSQDCDLSPNNFHCEGNIDWKIFRVMAELVEGFEFVNGLDKAVTILGTNRIAQDSEYFKIAHNLGKSFAKTGYAVVTGGKRGVAEAANKGAFEAGGVSLGIGMKFGNRAEVNPYLTRSILFSFPFTRKLIVTAPTKAFIFFPGGLGTMHQLFEILTLIQTGKMEPLPVILYDRKFWGHLDSYIRKCLLKQVRTIAKGDEDLYYVVDNEEEILDIVVEYEAKWNTV
jgi:uncharacterized protein (TIGR00730 family)